MAALVDAAGPYTLRPIKCPSPFKHLAEAIISQQISGSAAEAILERFVALFEESVDFPTPRAVLAVKEHRLRSVGLSAAKVAAIRDLALNSEQGRIPDTATLDTLEDADIIEQLTVVRGIGPWTVQMTLMFQLGRPDVLPIADYGVRNGFRIAYRLRDLPTPRELARQGEKWAPYRSAAAWYLWRAVDLDKSGIEWTRPKIRLWRAPPRGDASMRRQRSGAQTR